MVTKYELAVNETLWRDDCSACPSHVSYKNSSACDRQALVDGRCFRGNWGGDNGYFTYHFKLPPQWTQRPLYFQYRFQYWALGTWQHTSGVVDHWGGSSSCGSGQSLANWDCDDQMLEGRPSEMTCEDWMLWNDTMNGVGDTLDPYSLWAAADGDGGQELACFQKKAYVKNWTDSSLSVGFWIFDWGANGDYGLSGPRNSESWLVSDFELKFWPIVPNTTTTVPTSTTPTPTSTTTTIPTTTTATPTTTTTTPTSTTTVPMTTTTVPMTTTTIDTSTVEPTNIFEWTSTLFGFTETGTTSTTSLPSTSSLTSTEAPTETSTVLPTTTSTPTTTTTLLPTTTRHSSTTVQSTTEFVPSSTHVTTQTPTSTLAEMTSTLAGTPTTVSGGGGHNSSEWGALEFGLLFGFLGVALVIAAVFVYLRFFAKKRDGDEDDGFQSTFGRFFGAGAAVPTRFATVKPALSPRRVDEDLKKRETEAKENAEVVETDAERGGGVAVVSATDFVGYYGLDTDATENVEDNEFDVEMKMNMALEMAELQSSAAMVGIPGLKRKTTAELVSEQTEGAPKVPPIPAGARRSVPVVSVSGGQPVAEDVVDAEFEMMYIDMDTQTPGATLGATGGEQPYGHVVAEEQFADGTEDHYRHSDSGSYHL